MAAHDHDHVPGADADGHAPFAGRVLLAEPDPGASAAIVSGLRAAGLECDPVFTPEEAAGALAGAVYDAAVISLALGAERAIALAAGVRAADPAASIVALASDPSVEDALACMRAGAVDLLRTPAENGAVTERVGAAVQAARARRQQERKIKRLKSICKRLNASRKSVHEQVNVLCDDLVGAYQDMADQVKNVGVVSEFRASIKNELDIEQLLRTMLEYVLKKTGPTNAAVFLPANHADFSLGAYVNYDCPKDAADVLLDHLADVLPPRFQDEEGVFAFASMDELREWIGDDAAWLADSTALVAPCRKGGECLAVVSLFRDQNRPFDPEAADQLASIADAFAEQLATVISVHHRHMPGSSWSGWETEDDDGMAA